MTVIYHAAMFEAVARGDVVTATVVDRTTYPLFNICDASRMCGLSPSVLRIWELRYGWPRPLRSSNGYRCYRFQLVQELKRMADLMKTGAVISRIIVDGLPRWPVDVSARRLLRNLPRTLALVRSPRLSVARIQEGVIMALTIRNASVVHEFLQRAVWQLHPSEEPEAVLVPIVTAIAEARALGLPLDEESGLIAAVRIRVAQLVRMLGNKSRGLMVVPFGDDCAGVNAQLATLILSQHLDAVYAEWPPDDGSAWIMVGDHDTPGPIGRVTVLGGDGLIAISDLFNATTLSSFSGYRKEVHGDSPSGDPAVRHHEAECLGRHVQPVCGDSL